MKFLKWLAGALRAVDKICTAAAVLILALISGWEFFAA